MLRWQRERRDRRYATKLQLRRAFRCAASARRASPTLDGEPLHATLLTDAAGLEWSRAFARAGVFDRAVAVGEVAPAAKQTALRAALPLYERFVALDPDVVLCDGALLATVAAALRTKRRAEFGVASLGADVNIPWRRVAATPRLRRRHSVASAGTSTFCGVAATPRLRHGYSLETIRGDATAAT